MFKSYSDEEKKVNVLSFVFLFGPAFLDAALATIDFFVLTLKAKGEAEAFSGSIEGRGNSWCVTVSDACISADEAPTLSYASKPPAAPPTSHADTTDDQPDTAMQPPSAPLDTAAEVGLIEPSVIVGLVIAGLFVVVLAWRPRLRPRLL